MKTFLLISAVLAVAIIASWIDVVPVNCEVCGEQAFRTDITYMCCGGHGDVVHSHCVEVADAQPNLRIQEPISVFASWVPNAPLMGQQTEAVAAVASEEGKLEI